MLTAQPQVSSQTLTVQVRDASGRALPACITVISPEHVVMKFCQVDQDGRTTIPNLPPKLYRVSAKTGGYVMQQKEVDLRKSDNTLSFVMQRK
jgi:hypothetical protein